MKSELWTCETLRPVDDMAQPAFAIPEGLCGFHLHAFRPVGDYPAVANTRYDWPHIPQGSTDTGALFDNLVEWCLDEACRSLYQFD